MSCDRGDRDRNDTAANGGSLEPPETEREREERTDLLLEP